jgi:hypothetical protein
VSGSNQAENSQEEVIMKKELTVFALAAGLTSFSLPAFAEQDEATETRQPVKMTEQQLDAHGKRDHKFNMRSYRASTPTRATNAEIVELIERGVIPTQTPIDLDNYQTPPKDPCDWSWVYCRSACEQNWWVYCREGQ